MEYTFKNTAHDAAHTILLNDYNMTVRVSGNETVVPYANIVSVRLFKTSKQVFQMLITCTNQPPVMVSNVYISMDGKVDDRSRVYSTFVRVLHYHLKDKSKAVYKTGGSRKQLTRWSIALVTFAFVFCFVMDYLGLGFFNPYAEATVLSFVFLLILGMAYLRQLPKDYTAHNIPLPLLPV